MDLTFLIFFDGRAVDVESGGTLATGDVSERRFVFIIFSSLFVPPLTFVSAVLLPLVDILIGDSSKSTERTVVLGWVLCSAICVDAPPHDVPLSFLVALESAELNLQLVPDTLLRRPWPLGGGDHKCEDDPLCGVVYHLLCICQASS